MSKPNTKYEKLRETAENELHQIHELVRHLQERLPREPAKQKKHLHLGMGSSVLTEAKEIQELAKKGLRDTGKFMEKMRMEHSDVFTTPKMDKYLKTCEYLVRDLPWTIDKSPKPVQKIIREECQELVDSLKKDIELIKEERLTAQSQQVRWSIY